MSEMDWARVFAPSVPLLEIIVRGSVTYLAIFALLRILPSREAGGLNVTNLLMVVLLADAIQNGMAGGYSSVTDGLVLVVTILFWSYALDWLGYHVPGFERLIHAKPLPLVQDGQLLHRNMRQALVTKEELLEHLREQGIDDLSNVKEALLEGNGHISVVQYDEARHPKEERNPI
jgi:uncharacterized membrane protein YcaP (DUF421 family)